MEADRTSIILMIEAQAKYINAMISEVLAARTAGKSLAITPREERLAEFNAEIQKELNESSFADPNCNSWYKRADNGKITQNWSRNVVEYQKVSVVVPRWCTCVLTLPFRSSAKSTGAIIPSKAAERAGSTRRPARTLAVWWRRRT